MRRMSVRMRSVKVRARRSEAVELGVGIVSDLVVMGFAYVSRAWFSALVDFERVLVGSSGHRNARKPAFTVSAVKVRPYILL